MIIQTPTKSGQPMDKTVEVGGGVTVPVPGTRYHTTCEVLEIDEAGERVRVKGVGFEAWYPKNLIKDAQPPGAFAVEQAIHRDNMDDSWVG